LKGIHFVANTHNVMDIQILTNKGFDAIMLNRIFHVFKAEYSLFRRAYIKSMRLIFKVGRIMDYTLSANHFTGIEDSEENVYPSIIPNWDHSPRSGRMGHIFHNSNPTSFKVHVKKVLNKVKNKNKDRQVILLRSWNEWGEGNYMEPDLKYGKQYLEALRDAKKELDA
jgi:Glycosyltransferase WbsX